MSRRWTQKLENFFSSNRRKLSPKISQDQSKDNSENQAKGLKALSGFFSSTTQKAWAGMKNAFTRNGRSQGVAGSDLKTNKLRNRIIFSFFSATLVMGIILGVVLLPYTSGIVKDRIKEQSSAATVGSMENIRNFVNTSVEGLKMVGSSLTNVNEQSEIFSRFTDMTLTSKLYKGLIYVNAEGMEIVKRGSAITSWEMQNRKNDPAFVKAVDEGQYISPVLPDPNQESFYMEISVPVHDLYGQLKGVVISKIPMSVIWEQVREVGEVTDYRMFMISEDNYVIAHDDGQIVRNQRIVEGERVPPDQMVESPVLKDEAVQHLIEHREELISAGTEENEENQTSQQVVSQSLTGLDYEGVEVVSAYAIDPQYGWSLFIETPTASALAPVKEMTMYMVMIIVVSSILMVVWGIVLARLISNPVRQLVTATQAVAAGDLRMRTGIDRDDEIGLLARSFDKMVDDLQQIVLNVSDASEKTSSTAKEFTSVAREVSESASQIAVTIDEIARGAEDQANLSSKTDEGIKKLQQLVEEMAEKTEQVAAEADRTQATIRKSDEAFERLVEGIENVSQSTIQSAQEVKSLEQQTQEIGTIIETSNDIAKRTNLLALNAAIEAARAGEHGRGFAVVADEVRKLAEQSSKASQKIEEIITSVQEAIHEVVQKMEGSITRAKEESAQAVESREAMHAIEEAMHAVMDSVQQIEQLMEQQKSSTDEIAEYSHRSSELAMETSAGAEEVAASAEESTAVMEQVVSNADTLLQIAEELKERVKAFKL